MKMNMYMIRVLIVQLLIISGSLSAGMAGAQINRPLPLPDRVILNLTEEPTSSVAVTWRTDTTINSGTVEVQPAAPMIVPENNLIFTATTSTEKYNWEGEAEIISNHHSAILTGLEPGKQYSYRVGTRDYWSEWFDFQTAPADNSGFTFIYYGDPQSDIRSQWSRVIRNAFRKEPDPAFMLYAGDLINRPGRDTEWHEWFGAGSFIYASVPQLMTPGNHDYDGLKLAPHWNAQFTLPFNGPSGLKGTCYYVDYKNLRLISLDTATGGELRDEDGYEMRAQTAWLDSLLQENTKEWVIVTTHLPIYSPKENRDNYRIRRQFQPIMEKHGVDLVLTGHDHSYARGRATDNPQGELSIVYVVSVSGPKMYEIGDNKQWIEHKGANTQLYQVISIENNELVYKAYTTEGTLFDKFVIRKGPDGNNKFTDLRP
jgi:acid phosphatase type 7